MKKSNDEITGGTELTPDQSKEVQGTENTQYATSGTGPSSARIKACEGKKYGNYCVWIDNNGMLQDGKCIYNKYGISNGVLFCAKADYKSED